MAQHARLTPPAAEQPQLWPWHKPTCGAISSAEIRNGERRLEAESYLSTGFGIRALIEQQQGWQLFGDIAKIWMPGRLKGIQVSNECGTPFLAATQVYDVRPTVRKWLSLDHTADAENRFIRQGTILLTCSGSVGRATIAYATHENTLITHDLLRIEPNNHADKGWVYAFLLSPQAKAMATGARYGHIIKHLEPEHVQALPVPLVDRFTSERFQKHFSDILALRNRAYRLQGEADQLFAGTLGPLELEQPPSGFVVAASSVVEGRRRLEAAYHNPVAHAIFKRFERWEPLSNVAARVWWMARFKRYYGSEGITYLSADELFTVNPSSEAKRILVRPDDSHEDYFVKRGWIIMACSGQVYGLNGAAMLATEHHENTFFSHDLIRIVIDPLKARTGYALTALTHPTHGRPLLIRAAYGTSIPHLDPGDVSDFPLVRLDSSVESKIADLSEAAAEARADADALERKIANDADVIVADFMSGRKLQAHNPDHQQFARHILDTIAPDAE